MRTDAASRRNHGSGDAAGTSVNESGMIHKTVHVSPAGGAAGDGSAASPFDDAAKAAAVCPGSTILVHGGVYGRIALGPEASGGADSPTVIRAAEGERVLIRPDGGTGIRILNAHHLILEGFEVEGGTHGIRYESTREAGDTPLGGVAIRNCTVHGIRGVHGICVYARNDRAPVTDLTVEGCRVYDCECGSSESLVLNGNIEGFRIVSNVIFGNNNIGIDMIGFEGTAKHPGSVRGRNPYEADFVRRGVCRNNVVWGISTEGNMAYVSDGHFDPCADGIYVDGGQDIEIAENFVFCCDIGIEVATEHSPDDNPLFRVSGIRVHDNVIAGCRGFAGLCFGGYARHLGYTEGCEFDHNTLVDNDTQIAVQRSRDNRIHRNLILGGESGVVFNESCRPEDLVNRIDANAAAGIRDRESWRAEYGPLSPDRAALADGFRTLAPDVGSRWIPAPEWTELCREQMKRESVKEQL